jgi:serine/threonine protein kinase
VGEPSATAPHVIGRYALYDRIASGGMATVHLGRLLGSAGFARTVAIKRLHPQFAGDPEFVSMFLDEARLVARISHPNVIPTLDVVTTGGELSIVMEYVRGESLSRLIRAAAAEGETIPVGVAAAILVGVLHGLHAAHEAKNERGVPLGIVHRDVSPHNILVGVDGVPRVLDFGVAKAMGRVGTTREGQLKGKLAYMSPEQLSGVTTRATDVYAASVVLWEVLTGRRLFQGDNEGHLFDLVRQGSKVPPSSIAPGAPRELDEVTLRGLARDPAARYETARDMAHALEEAVALASASKVGAWVERAAKTTLDLRSERIAAIESSSWTQPPSSLGARRTETRLAVREARGDDPPASLSTEAIPIVAEDFTQLSSESASAAKQTRSGLRPRTILVVLGACLATGAGLALFLAGTEGMGRPKSSPAAATQARQAESSTPAAAQPPASPEPLPQAPPVSSSSPPTALPTASASSAPPATTPAASASEAPPPRPVAPPRRNASLPSDHCTPPFYFDPKGMRIFKKECL